MPLGWQDPRLWDAAMIAEAEALLRRASGLGAIGRFQLEGALQSAHVHRCRSGRGRLAARWSQLYDALLALSGSPVVAINRALAVARVRGRRPPASPRSTPSPATPARRYQPYWAARAELLARSGATAAAREAYEIAIGLERDPAVRRFLQNCRAALEA